MAKHTCNIYRVARQCGVHLFDRLLHSPTSRRPYECYCKTALRHIGQSHGEPILKQSLMLVCGTPENAAELYEDVLKAVAALLVTYPDLEKRPDFVDRFNAIDLAELRRTARRMRLPIARKDVLTVLLAVNFGKAD